jgi:hypothetical protein
MDREKWMKGRGWAQIWGPTPVLDWEKGVGTEENHDKPRPGKSVSCRYWNSAPLEFNSEAFLLAQTCQWTRVHMTFQKGNDWRITRLNYYWHNDETFYMVSMFRCLHDSFMALTGIYPDRLCDKPERFKRSTSWTAVTTLTVIATSLTFRVWVPDVSQGP